MESKTCHNCGQIGFTCGDCINRSEWIPKQTYDMPTRERENEIEGEV